MFGGLQRFEFDISSRLPFAKLPIGDGSDHGKATLQGLVDTGGCCMMGWLPYHQKIYQQFPQLVKSFIDLQDQKYEQISIGGVAGAVKISHMISYHLPFVHQGEQASLTIGLTADLPINTLIGLSFQVKAAMTLDLQRMTLHSKIFNETFPVEMIRPERVPIEHINYMDPTYQTLATRPQQQE